MSTNHVNFGVFLTFDYVFTNQKKHHYYLESYLNSLLKLMLKKYQKLFLIAPDFNYAVFIALNGTKSKSEQLLNFRQHLITIVNYLNQLINASANNGYFKVFYADFGATFYDLVPLIKITELGIYNLDYTDQVYCKQFQQKHFLAELTTAKEKKQLKV